MNNWGTEFRVGVFTLLGLAVTVFAIFVISPDLFDTQKKSRYYTILKDAAGILPKTHVKTNGVNIGKVYSVELADDATKVVVEINRDVKVPQGSVIEVRTVGFLGDKFLEIKRKSESSEMIPEGGLIPRSTDTVELNEVISTVGGIAQDIKKITANLSKVLGDQRGEERITNIVDNIEQFTKDAKGILQENRDNVKTLVENFKEVSSTLRDVLDEENKEKVDRIIAALDRSMTEVEGATKNINLIAAKVERGEGTLGRLINDDDTIDDLQGAIKDLRNVLAPVANLQVGVDYHGEFRKDESTQHYFNLNLYTRPNHYYIIGFTDTKNDVVDTTTETIDGDNSDSVVRSKETINRERALKFNLQFARRWYWAAVRFGLFESTGGLAADFYLWRDRLRFTAEAFDFSDKGDKIRKTAHLKAYASVLFFDHLSAMVGVDDPTKYDAATGKVKKDKNYFFGAGLSFNDQDLKALFGIAAMAKP